MTYQPPGQGYGQGYPDPSGYGAGQPQQPPGGPYPQQPPGAPYPQQPPAAPYPQQPPAAPYPQQPPGGPYPQQPPAAYPQQPPGAPYQDPVSGMPSDPYQQPGYGPPGYPPQQPPYGGPGFPPPQQPGSKAPLIVALALVAVLLIGGMGTVVFLTVSNEGEPQAAPPSASASPSESPSPSPSPTPSPTETEEGDRVSADEYDKDWDFRLGDVKLSADHVEGWDYDDCTEFERNDALTDAGCDYGVEVTYKAEGGKVRVSNLFLVMTDQDASEQVNKDLDDEDFRLHKESYLKDFSYGKWKRKFNGRYVVITICTAAKSVSEEKAGRYLHYMNADMSAAFSFR